MSDCFLGTKEILEGDTLHKLKPIDKRFDIDEFVRKQLNLHAYFVISNRSIHDIIIVCLLPAGVETIIYYEFRPLNRIIIEDLYFERRILQHFLVKEVFINDRTTAKEQSPLLRQLACLMLVGGEVETFAKILIGLGLGKINLLNIRIGAMIEFHTSAPPFR